MNVLGICAGIGGLELGLSLVAPTRPICFIEQNQFCAEVLSRRWPGVPIWDDVLTFKAKPWRGHVDLITAGFPCQPWSLSGKRKKTEDARWIWPAIAKIIRDIRPKYVFLENVPGLLGGGIQEVCKDLASNGFDAEWGMFSNQRLRAPHRRKRWMLLAYTNSTQHEVTGGQLRTIRLNQNGFKLAHSDGSRLEEWHCRLEPQRSSAQRSSLSFWPKTPDDDWSEVDPSQWPAEFPVCGETDGFPRWMEPDRTNRIKALGNAVSPPVAAAAWLELRERIRQRGKLSV